MENDEPQALTQNDEVREAYRNLTHARRRYRQATGSEVEYAAHQHYHDAAFALYDELRGRLKQRRPTQPLWEEADLWPVEQDMTDVTFCAACELMGEASLAEEASVCPNCESERLEVFEVPATDENGDPVYRWETGLEQLDHYRHRVETETVSFADATGTHEKTETTRQLLSPPRLEVVADLLGEAMERLGLYPDAVAGGEPDDEAEVV